MPKKPTNLQVVPPMGRVFHAKPESERMDGWTNVVTSLGTSKDPRLAGQLNWENRPPEFYEQLYAGGGIAARIADLIPEESMREWVNWTNVPLNRKEEIDERCQEIDVRGIFLKTWKWARAYGGACLHIVTNTNDPSSPLQRGEKVLALRDLSRWDLRILTTDVEYDFGCVNWGHPRIYYLNMQMGSQYKGYPIHWSRMIRFDGQLVPRRTYIRNNYWHDSVLNRIYNALRNYEQAHDAMAACLLSSNVDVFAMQNLSQLMSAGKESLVKNRIELLAFAKSVLNAVIIDADKEKYENVKRNLEGTAELLVLAANRLVAETDIPHTKLLGESPDGSNGTGNSTSQHWYNFISAEEENYAKPRMHRLIDIIFQEEKKLRFTFKPLRKLDALEKADLRLKTSQADALDVTNQILDPSEIAMSRYSGDEYSTETKLDLKAREQGLIGPGSADYPEGEGEGEQDGGPTKPPIDEEQDKEGGGDGETSKPAESKAPKGDAEPETGRKPNPEQPLDPHYKGEPIDATRMPDVSGAEFALRNEVIAVKNAQPKAATFIGQTMSEPMRDPRTDPAMKGPGIPNQPRNILPTRGTGVVAPSGYDFEKDKDLTASSREGVEGSERADAYQESKHPRGPNGEWGSGGTGGEAESHTSKIKSAQQRETLATSQLKQHHEKIKGQASWWDDPKYKDLAAEHKSAVRARQTTMRAAKSFLEKQKGDNQATDYAEERGDTEPSRAAQIIVRDGDKFLMGRRRDTKKWAFPGGHVEDGESHHQGAVRELAEETGLVASRLKFLGARMVEPEQGKNVHINLYQHHKAEGVTPTFKDDPDKEFGELRWFPIGQPLPEDVAQNLAHPNNVALIHMGLLR